MNEVMNRLKRKELFSKEQFRHYYQEGIGGSSDEAISYALRKMLGSGAIVRVGWNSYSVPQEKRIYQHIYSDRSCAIAESIQEEYLDARFQIFELIQLNNFMNHQIAHNSIFVFVENELVDFVFDSLNRIYPGRVMLKPSLEHYYRYLQDDEIVIGRLPSESPMGLVKPWYCRLEKILVDIAVDKLLANIVPSGEIENIFEEAFSRYLIDEKTMIRYAKRKGAEKKLIKFLKEFAPYVLEGGK